MGIKTSSLRRLPHQTHEPAYLPKDVIFDILSRIPERSLRQFRCVSKEWCALISDPVFVDAHRSRAEPLLVVASRPNFGLRLVDMDGNVVRVMNTNNGWFWRPMSTSPDGVVCVHSHPNGIDAVGVIDLATMKVFVTNDGGKGWGFGRAVPSGAYKLVRFVDQAYCEVFTIGGVVGWKRRKSRPFSFKCYSLDNYTATINGMLYFLPVVQQDMYNILCFELESEEWKQNIKGPSNVDLILGDISLGPLNDALCVAELNNLTTNHGSTDIWLLNDLDKSIWVKAYTIPLDTSIFSDSITQRWMIPLRVLRNGSKLLFYYCGALGLKPRLQIYDTRYMTCTDVTEKLLGGDGTAFGFCSSHLERFVSTKIQRPISSFRFI